MQNDNKYLSESLLLSNPRKAANASLLILAAYLRSLPDEKLESDEYLIARTQDDTTERYGAFSGCSTDFWNILIPRGFQQVWDNLSFPQIDDKIIDLCEGGKIIFGEEPIKMVVGVNRMSKLAYLVYARMENFKRWLVNIGDHYCGAIRYLKAKDEYRYPVGIGYAPETRGVFIYRSLEALQILSSDVPTAEESVVLDMLDCVDPAEVPRFRSVAEEHKINLAIFPANKFYMNLHRSSVNFPAAEGR